MAKYAIALDQGTTSSRAMVFNHEGRVESVAQKEHEQIYPKPGWVEHDPAEIWARSQEVIKGALEKAGIAASDLADAAREIRESGTFGYLDRTMSSAEFAGYLKKPAT